jgi:hypothetical protein
VGDHRHVVRRDLDGGGAHVGGELALGIGRDGLIAVGDQEPARGVTSGPDGSAQRCARRRLWWRWCGAAGSAGGQGRCWPGARYPFWPSRSSSRVPPGFPDRPGCGIEWDERAVRRFRLAT